MTQFPAMIDQLLTQYQAVAAAAGVPAAAADLTVVFDAGQNSQDNFAHLAGANLHYIGSVWSTPGLVETRFSPDALVWVAVVFHGTAAWRNHGLIIFPLLFYRTSVQLRCPAAPPGGGLRPPGRPPGLGYLLVGHPLCAAGSPGGGKGDAQRHRLRRRRRP